MSIVERAADKLKQTETKPRTRRRGDSDSGPPVSDHVAAAGEKLAATTAHHPSQQGTKDQSPRQAGPGTVVTSAATTQAKPQLTIDFANLRRAGLMPPVSGETAVAREYQRIKRPLLANAAGVGMQQGIADVNCFMVASAIPGEGKTFSSFNLALSLSKERDYTVVLVDGDIIKPTISRALGLAEEPGLTDILADQSLVPEDMVLDTSLPGFSVLPAGRRHEQATELLASHRMSWLINELSRDPNRMLVFDSSPLLATSESQALAMTMGQILVVVRAGRTNQNAVLSALSLVAAPDKSVSLILNQTTKAHGDYYAGYYGGYYDGHETSV